MIVKSISLQNRQLYYKTAGSGIPLVLIHGFAEDSRVWQYQADALAAAYHLIIPDLPGSGPSALIEDMSIEGMADSIKQILEQELAVPLDQVPGSIYMIGHSMGGYITLAFAAKYAGALAGFGLFHSTAFADSEEKKSVRRRGISFIQTHGSYEFIKQSVPNLFAEAYRNSNSGAINAMARQYSGFDPRALVLYYEAMIQRPDRTAVLRSFSKPVLFIIGRNDKAVPFEDSMQQCHLPGTAFVTILENAAHMGMWEEPAASTEALLRFLRNTAV